MSVIFGVDNLENVWFFGKDILDLIYVSVKLLGYKTNKGIFKMCILFQKQIDSWVCAYIAFVYNSYCTQAESLICSSALLPYATG